MNWIFEPWPWYISGPLIALTMFTLLFAGKQFGMSSNLRTICAVGGGGKWAEFFRFDWRSQRWNLIVALGVAVGGFIAANYLSNNTVAIADSVAQQLANDYNITSAGSSYLPKEIFATENMFTPFNLSILFIGGLLVGFGARYAGGCTSGHAISGISNMQLPSLVATIGFFIGGLIMVHLLFPLIF